MTIKGVDDEYETCAPSNKTCNVIWSMGLVQFTCRNMVTVAYIDYIDHQPPRWAVSEVRDLFKTAKSWPVYETGYFEYCIERIEWCTAVCGSVDQSLKAPILIKSYHSIYSLQNTTTRFVWAFRWTWCGEWTSRVGFCSNFQLAETMGTGGHWWGHARAPRVRLANADMTGRDRTVNIDKLKRTRRAFVKSCHIGQILRLRLFHSAADSLKIFKGFAVNTCLATSDPGYLDRSIDPIRQILLKSWPDLIRRSTRTTCSHLWLRLEDASTEGWPGGR